MPEQPCVLVVGATTDYVDWIRNARPGLAVFVTSPEERRKAVEPAPSEGEEILCDLEDTGQVAETLSAHFSKHRRTPAGVACFDCESMPLAAQVALHFNLDYPSPASIRNCRDKRLARILWHENNLDCPPFAPVSTFRELAAFFGRQKRPIVLKPASGSGSELVCLCESLAECEKAYRIVSRELERRKENRLYSGTDTPKPLLAEAMVAGREYSCDFIWTGNEAKIIRVAEKIKKPAAPFGTIGGYLLPASLPGAVSGEALASVLADASRALGLTRAICMADFILSNGRIFMLEMAPRPGGDCLPFMLRYAQGMDMLALVVDFAAGRPAAIPASAEKGVFMGVRVHSPKPGILGHVGLENDGREMKILETHFIRNPGHRIHMPPADYESWFLGHVIVKLKGETDPDLEYQRVCSRLHIEVEDGRKGNGNDRRTAF
jgi:hypothetical protein